MLLRPIPLLYRRRAGAVRRRPPAPPAPPLALTLVSASFNPGGGGAAMLRLSFNKAVDVSGIFPGNLQVEDAVGGKQWEGVNAMPVVAATVDVEMAEIAAQAYPDTRLTALEPTGIVAVDDAEAWGGVTDLLLPFP